MRSEKRTAEINVEFKLTSERRQNTWKYYMPTAVNSEARHVSYEACDTAKLSKI